MPMSCRCSPTMSVLGSSTMSVSELPTLSIIGSPTSDLFLRRRCRPSALPKAPDAPASTIVIVNKNMKVENVAKEARLRTKLISPKEARFKTEGAPFSKRKEELVVFSRVLSLTSTFGVANTMRIWVSFMDLECEGINPHTAFGYPELSCELPLKANIPSLGGTCQSPSKNKKRQYATRKKHTGKTAIMEEPKRKVNLYNSPEFVMPLHEFIHHPMAFELVHNGATFQVAGITNNSHLEDAEEIRNCVLQYEDLGHYILDVAKKRIEKMFFVGLTDKHEESAKILANLIGKQMPSKWIPSNHSVEKVRLNASTNYKQVCTSPYDI
eukprot:Gb_27871 [translate_table: standard]